MLIAGGEGLCMLQGRGQWEASVPSTRFGCEPKTALKNKVMYK